MRWAQGLERVLDVERCERGGQLKRLAAIEDPVVIVRIFTHLGLPARAPLRAPGRHRLTQEQDDGSAAEPTGLLDPRLRDGIGPRLTGVGSRRCRARSVTARRPSFVGARLTARSTADTVPTGEKAFRQSRPCPVPAALRAARRSRKPVLRALGAEWDVEVDPKTLVPLDETTAMTPRLTA